MLDRSEIGGGVLLRCISLTNDFYFGMRPYYRPIP